MKLLLFNYFSVLFITKYRPDTTFAYVLALSYAYATIFLIHTKLLTLMRRMGNKLDFLRSGK
jgi:hypothetical protein